MKCLAFGGEITKRRGKCICLHGGRCASQRRKEAWGLGTFIVSILLCCKAVLATTPDAGLFMCMCVE